MICIHHNDLDGRCAAAIVEYFGNHPGDKVFYVELDYKDFFLAESVKDKHVVIVDFSFKPEVMTEIINCATSVVWIDHHATAKDYPYQNLPGLRNFHDKQKSGCELAWDYYARNLSRPMPLAIQLIGDYDKWALAMPDSKAFYEGMKMVKNEPRSEIWVSLIQDMGDPCKTIIFNGNIAMSYRDNYCNDLCNSFGYETTIDGYRAYACNQTMFGSGGFGHRFHQYPLCVAYIDDGKRFTVSLYSETVDVSVIAKNHGGGGHRGAAGFICEVLPFGI